MDSEFKVKLKQELTAGGKRGAEQADLLIARHGQVAAAGLLLTIEHSVENAASVTAEAIEMAESISSKQALH